MMQDANHRHPHWMVLPHPAVNAQETHSSIVAHYASDDEPHRFLPLDVPHICRAQQEIEREDWRQWLQWLRTSFAVKGEDS